MEWLGIDICVLFRLNNNLQIKILLLPKKDDRDTLDEPRGEHFRRLFPIGDIESILDTLSEYD